MSANLELLHAGLLNAEQGATTSPVPLSPAVSRATESMPAENMPASSFPEGPSNNDRRARLRVLDPQTERSQALLRKNPWDEPSGDSLYTTADTLSVGSIAEVVSISASCSELRHKLLSLGVVAGTRLEVSGLAPLKDPMKVKLLGFTLSLRLCEAECIRVKRVL